MEYSEQLGTALIENWHVWFVSIVLVVAAVIDGKMLKVPNWLTFPMIISGWIYSASYFALTGDAWYVGLGWSLFGTVVGLACLLPAYAIGGMGAGDVKLMAGIGAWVYGVNTFYAFCWTCVIGAVIAVAMVVISKQWNKHKNQFFLIVNEISMIKDPNQLSAIAAERKPSMMLLPYGIPIAIGSILYFAWTGMLI
ncbi:A24 family peptidase [Lignipirellula cremea]|uniref:Type IV leader peptidase family protein n=1 Tax=Lignipirellula cremea TaxID=2528010 RepID=A0A518E1L7_9BACT|nr:A24 family peptidase [Lignipirellula cremea]QDU97963.1 Type IV leader peptidase family protein [Lignipirellula cremea]